MHRQVVRLLLAAKADATRPNRFGRTAVTTAAERGSAAMCDLLIQAAARSMVESIEVPSLDLEDPKTFQVKRKPRLAGNFKNACGMDM